MVVGDDQVDSESMRGLGGSEGADAHVHTDDESNTRGGGTLDDIVAHVVAVANAVRHMKVGGASAEFDRRSSE